MAFSFCFGSSFFDLLMDVRFDFQLLCRLSGMVSAATHTLPPVVRMPVAFFANFYDMCPAPL
jgi:hypothetical protein